MYNKIIIAVILLMIYQSFAAKQEVTVLKNGVSFSLVLLSPDELHEQDTIKIKYTISNNSRKPIVVVDLDIPGKTPRQPIFVNDNLDIEINLGGRGVAGLGGLRKFKIVKNGQNYSRVFKMPLREFVTKYSMKRKSDQDWPYLKDIPVVAFVAYSNSKEFFDGELTKATGFDDYWGHIEGWEGTGIELYLDMFEISGITIKLYF